MVSLSGIVNVVVVLLVAGCVFALLAYLIEYVGKQFSGAEPFVKVARIVLVVLAVLFLIGLLLNWTGAMPGPFLRP